MYVGLCVAGLIRTPIAWAFPIQARARVLNITGVFAGLGTILAAIGLFWLLGTHSGIAVPIICAAWVTFYFFSYNQSKLEWVCYVGGIAIGWFVLHDYFQRW
jgi:hypothetical protein